MKKISKEKMKNFWETHKQKILVGVMTTGGLVLTGLIMKHSHSTKKKEEHILWERDLDNFGNVIPSIASREIPKTEMFNIIDIADDLNDGCVTWLDGCKLSDCGKLGEGLCKIERVNPDMLVTMAILGKGKIEINEK